MKIVIKEWLKDKTACKMMGGYFIGKIIYLALNSWIIALVSSIISDPLNSKNKFIMLAVTCVMQFVNSVIIAYFGPLSMNHCSTLLNNRYVEKIVDSDVNMFTKFSVAGISTAHEFIWEISKVGLALIQLLLHIIEMIIVLTSMYLVGGNVVIPVIVLYLIGGFLMKYLFKKYSILDEEAATIKKQRNQEVENIVNGFQEVRTFNTQYHHKNRINMFNSNIYKLKVKRAVVNSSIDGCIEIVDSVGLFVIVIYVIRKIALGAIEQSVGMALVMYVFKLIVPMLSILNFIDSLSGSLSLSKQFDEIVSYKNICDDNKSKNELEKFTKEICVSNVYFSYNGNDDVVCGVDMVFEKGKKYGICGPSGSGKSTMFKLLNKFYDPSEGYITIDGKDLREISTHSYRSLLGVVHQDDVIFPGNIYDNITYGNFDANMNQIIEACKKANIYDFIMSLPDTWTTEVGPRGLTLSGGQKKRISLARLFLRNPEIILLDEATAALDNNGERIIQDAIDKLKDKTTITIAHRLSTIENCDVIYVMEKGRVVESGSHDELMNKRGLYYELNPNKNKEEV